MKEEMELLNLLIANPHLKVLQDKLDYDMRNMSSEQRCTYLQELMLDNCEELKNHLTKLVRLVGN